MPNGEGQEGVGTAADVVGEEAELPVRGHEGKHPLLLGENIV